MDEGGCSAAEQNSEKQPATGKLIVPRASDLIDVQSKAELVIINDLQVPNRILRANVWKSNGVREPINASQTPATSKPDNQFTPNLDNNQFILNLDNDQFILNLDNDRFILNLDNDQVILNLDNNQFTLNLDNDQFTLN